MGLFWIAPYTYINLDSKNRTVLKRESFISENIKQQIKGFENNLLNGISYLNFCKNLKVELGKNNNGIINFPSFSFYAEQTIGYETSDNDINSEEINMSNTPLNQILYGPPGTGKTYSTILKAMSILDNTEYRDVNENEYLKLKERFDNFKKEHRIEFVTFHQSYSYEDFVEGIKPYISDWGNYDKQEISYIGQNGIFKEICKNAERELYQFDKNEKIDFEKTYKIFQEKYEEGSSFANLLDIRYESDNFVYHYGQQTGDRRIELAKIKELFDSNIKYATAIEFNRDYKGNSVLKGYFFNFYKELIKIREDLEDENNIKEKINQNSKKYILIIDEINRGDVSKIFGELITLIEEDKRIGNKYATVATLPYSKEQFGIPNNLYIIGTMNTADRSIALLDTALRRRFDFEEMMPRPELLKNKVIDGINLQKLLENINKRITEKYDKDHQIGHSYLIGVKTKEQLERVYKNRILPLLNEYFYNDTKTVSEILKCNENEFEDCLIVLNKAQRD